MMTWKDALQHFGVILNDDGSVDGKRGFRVRFGSENKDFTDTDPSTVKTWQELVAMDEDGMKALKIYKRARNKDNVVRGKLGREWEGAPEDKGCLQDIRIKEDGINRYFSERTFRDSSPELCGYQFMDQNYYRERDEFKPVRMMVEKVSLPKLNWDRLNRFTYQREMNFIALQSKCVTLLRAQDITGLVKLKKRVLDVRDASFDQKVLDTMVFGAFCYPAVMGSTQQEKRDIYINRADYKKPGFVRNLKQELIYQVYEQSRKLDFNQSRVLLLMVDEAIQLVKKKVDTFPEVKKQVTTLKFDMEVMMKAFNIYLRDGLREQYEELKEELGTAISDGDMETFLHLDRKITEVKKVGVAWAAHACLKKDE